MYEKLFNLAPVQLPAVRLSIGVVLAQGLRKIVVAVERLYGSIRLGQYEAF